MASAASLKPTGMPANIRISKSKWPWGRTPPARRISDLQAMIARNRAQIPIIRDQAEEAVRRIEMNIGMLEDQIRDAERCREEEVRARNKQISYELSLRGIQVMDRVDDAADQKALNAELEKMLAQAPTEAAASNQPERREDAVDLDGFFKS